MFIDVLTEFFIDISIDMLIDLSIDILIDILIDIEEEGEWWWEVDFFFKSNNPTPTGGELERVPWFECKD